ncbi:MAG: hypothetical protein J5379_06230 [Clostridiales bacterium]|nr:hypothetical protein [Clostridiales bacterium]
MKNSGGKDTLLLFVVLLLALGAVCYIFIIKKNVDKLHEVKNELAVVEQEKAKNDAIIQQAQELDAQRENLKNQIQTLETKLPPELYTSAIQRKLYKHFEDAGIPFIVEVSNTALSYDTVTLPGGSPSPNRVKTSRYIVQVSGTDGWLLTHDEGDDIPYTVFYTQLKIPSSQANVPVNKEAQEYGHDSANEFRSETYVGYEQFVTALKKIQSDAPDYVKIADIQIEDTKQGFCYYTVGVDVYAYELIDRISAAPTDMNYMTWVGAQNIATGGLVGLPNYFVIDTPNYKVPTSSPLYGHYISFTQFDFAVTRPFAAWNHWGYEWINLDVTLSEIADLDPELASLKFKYSLGMMSYEDYNKAVADYNKTIQDNGGVVDASLLEQPQQTPAS